MRLSEITRLDEVHFEDKYPDSFVEFRKRYAKVAKRESIDDLYVQFTSHKDNTMDRTAHATPDHKDFVGTYGYPLDYVLKYTSDVWYGQGSRYLRVLKKKTDRVLVLNEIESDIDARVLLRRMGFTSQEAVDMVAVASKHLRDRIKAPNKAAKLFLACVQMDLLATPEDSGGRKVFPTRSGLEQSALVLKAGYNAVEDRSRSDRQAIVNDREPEQIIFLNRAAFEVVEVVALRPEMPAAKLPTLTHPSPEAASIERPLAAALAEAMGDRLKEGPERSNLNGWSYYWTGGGRRIEIMFQKPDSYYANKSWGQKKHRADKLSDADRIFVTVQSERGPFKKVFSSQTKFKDIVAEFAATWRGMAPSGSWTPESLASFHKKRKDERDAEIQKQIDRERSMRLGRLAEFLGEVAWVARHYGLPFAPNSDHDLNAELIDHLDRFGRLRRSRSLDEAAAFVEKDISTSPAHKALLPQWKMIEAIIRNIEDDLKDDDSAFMILRRSNSFIFRDVKDLFERRSDAEKD